MAGPGGTGADVGPAREGGAGWRAGQRPQPPPGVPVSCPHCLRGGLRVGVQRSVAAARPHCAPPHRPVTRPCCRSVAAPGTAAVRFFPPALSASRCTSGAAVVVGKGGSRPAGRQRVPPTHSDLQPPAGPYPAPALQAAMQRAPALCGGTVAPSGTPFGLTADVSACRCCPRSGA